MVGVRWVGERRVLRRASHQSLKVPVFRDQSFDALSRNDPATTYARGDWDVDYRRSDGNEGWGTVDLERSPSGDRDEVWETTDQEDTGPLPVVREFSRPAPVPLEDDSWDARPHHAERRLGPPAPGTLTFKPATSPWYGSSQRLLMFVVGAAIVAMIVAGVLLVLRHSDSGTDETTTVTPTATTGATPQPAPPPNTVGEGALPPGVPGDLPPPPPPPEATSAPPPATGGGYRWRPTQDPDEGSTLRPRTPPPISVAPVPRQAPEPGHSAPGDAPRRHRGFF